MTNEELIEALRYCVNYEIRECDECPFNKKYRCRDLQATATADALEAADEMIADCVAAIDALDDSNDAYIKENERLKKRIEELEAQLPKRGEWIMCESEKPYIVWKCSVCGGLTSEVGHYCPNCGARMDGKELQCEDERRRR